MSKALWERILLVVGSSLFTLFLAEVGTRAYLSQIKNHQSTQEGLQRSKEQTRTVDNPSLGGLVEPSTIPGVVYGLKKNITGNFLNRPLRTNSLGFRGPEYAVEKAPDLFRVAVIGDSVAFGWGVNEENRYSSVLETRFRSKGRTVEFLNFAVPGYNTAIEVSIFEHVVRPFQPDLLILHFVNNDFEVPFFMQRRENYLSLTRSFLFDLIFNRLTSSLTRPKFGDMGESAGEAAEEFRHMTGAGGVTRAFDRLRELAPELPVIVVRGGLSKEQNVLLTKLSAKHKLRQVDVGPYVERYVQEHNIPNTPEGRMKALTRGSGDPHPNLYGHEIYANALEDALREMIP